MNNDKYVVVTANDWNSIQNGGVLRATGYSLRRAGEVAHSMAEQHGEVYILKVVPTAVYKRSVAAQVIE